MIVEASENWRLNKQQKWKKQSLSAVSVKYWILTLEYMVKALQKKKKKKALAEAEAYLSSFLHKSEKHIWLLT